MEIEWPNNQGIYFHDDVVTPLTTIFEEWLGIPLSPDDVTMFGIRFLRGAWMSLFADPYPAHAFGIILQVKISSGYFQWTKTANKVPSPIKIQKPIISYNTIY